VVFDVLIYDKKKNIAHEHLYFSNHLKSTKIKQSSFRKHQRHTKIKHPHFDRKLPKYPDAKISQFTVIYILFVRALETGRKASL
jgi:hypothetical protein